MKEPGEPQVSMSLTEDGVNLTIHAIIKGDGTDWTNDLVGAWILGIWEKARLVAEISSEYGLGPTRPEVSSPPKITVVSRDPEPTPHDERQKLEGLIQRCVDNQTLLPVAGKKKLPTGEWRRRALEEIRNHEGVRSSQLQALDPSLTRNAIQQRLYDLRNKGLIEFRLTGTAPNQGHWYALEVTNEPTGDPVTAVLDYTRGKTFLMLGGRPNVNSKHELEKQLSLKELRWMDYEENDPVEWRLREIQREDVDAVIINRWNKKYSKEFIHAAQQAGKPYLYLMRGYGVNTVAAELKKQMLDDPSVGASIAA